MKSMSLKKVINHIRNRTYMSGLERDRLRVKSTGEVFTPKNLVSDILRGLPEEEFGNPEKTFLDPSCGDGQFLGEVLIRKLENGIDFETSLSTIYGIDIMQDNVLLCKERLLCGREDLKHIVDKNIIVGDFWKVKNFKFDGTDPYKSNQDLHNEKLFDFE